MSADNYLILQKRGQAFYVWEGYMSNDGWCEKQPRAGYRKFHTLKMADKYLTWKVAQDYYEYGIVVLEDVAEDVFEIDSLEIADRLVTYIEQCDLETLLKINNFVFKDNLMNYLSIAREIFDESFTDGFVCSLIWNQTNYLNNPDFSLYRAELQKIYWKMQKFDFLTNYGK